MQYTILFDWIFELAEPRLTLAEVATYSIIYSFSRDSRGTFLGSYKYMSRLTGLSERQQIRVLEKLLKRGLVIKKETSFGYPNEYFCNLSLIPNEVKDELSKRGYDRTSHHVTKSTNTHDINVSKMSDNNKEKINISNNKLILDNLDKSNLSRISCSRNSVRSRTREEEPDFRQMSLAETGIFNDPKNHK